MSARARMLWGVFAFSMFVLAALMSVCLAPELAW